ncbi:hypothetical protein RUND412_000172 [Rhizina undulata]
MLRALTLTEVFFAGVLFLGVAVKAQNGAYQQCGGVNWTGSTTCVDGYYCSYLNAYYSQCIPGTATTTAATTSGTVTTSSSKTTGTSTSTSTSAAASSTATDGPRTDTGKLPALGWNTWNAYGGSITEALVLDAANSFISLGLYDLGYEYVNIDDCWAQLARTDGVMVPDATKFPNGIDGLADSIHALGLKIGIYSDAGSNTCSGYPGSLDYETVDAQTFSDWGVDYLKYDNCNVPSSWADSGSYTDWTQSNSYKRYHQMTTALNSVTRPILYSLCNWGNAQVWTWGHLVGHSWRMTGDSSDTWSYIQSAITNNAQYLEYVDFWAHNDMDMMADFGITVTIANSNSNSALTTEETRTHFAAWAFMKSPILLGTVLSSLTTTELAIIKNAELLAFHQDATYGAAATQYNTTSPPEYFSGYSVKGVHVFVLNSADSAVTKTVTFADVPGLGDGTWLVHDMWTGTDVGSFTGSYEVVLAAHDVLAILVTAV